MQTIIIFLHAHKTELLVLLIAISEFLGTFQWFKANSICQLIANTLKSMAPKKEETPVVEATPTDKAA